MDSQTYSYAGMLTTALRWVAGWTYFSAFWRRLVLDYKLDPEGAGYIGEKFNHFLPNALGIKPLIEYLVSHPDALWWAMASFTIIEGVVGLLFMLGLFTRLMSIGVFSLAMGILLGSGWLGTTCLDEWQIGVLGVASGFTIFMTGGGKFSLDEYFIHKNVSFSRSTWFGFLGSGVLPLQGKTISTVVLTGSLLILGLTLFTNQYFHGGVYGDLHNKSVRPIVEISDAKFHNDSLSLTVFRVEGADVYGSFLIRINVLDPQGNTVHSISQTELAAMSPAQISNDYIAQVKPGPHSLILPLGARATLTFGDTSFGQMDGAYTLELIDISGIRWKAMVK